ncbi:MAG: helix-turn-helix domain-containing protein [Sedimentisphaeraceae bacterium JB056]
MIFDFEFQPGPFHRTMGPAGSRELIGAGFMKKRPGIDHYNFDPPTYSLSYVINGTGSYKCSIGEWGLSQGSFFQRIPGFTHSTFIGQDDQWIECFIDFGTGLCNTLCQMGMIDTTKPCGKSVIDRSIPETIAQFRRTLENCNNSQLRMLLPQFIEMQQQIIATTPNQYSVNQNIVMRACRLLTQDLHQRIDLKLFCKENGWGYENFRKIFKSETGISPSQYRLRRRIDEAKRLLLVNRNEPLVSIAYQLGYTNVYEFSSQFRKLTGLPPGKFRNQ